MKTTTNKTDLIISIKNPCSQNFKNFDKTEKGGYCMACNKEVIDFRNFTKKEIDNYFENKKETICGLLNSNQINNHSEMKIEPNVPKQYIYKSIFGFTFLTLFSFNSLHSQKIIKDSIKIEKSNKIENTINHDFVKGVIYNMNGPLAGASIVIKNKDLKTISDQNGKFSFTKKLSKKDILVISYIGHITREIKVSDILGNEIMLHTYFDKEEFVIMGEINVKQNIQPKPTLFQRIKSLFIR